MDRKTMDQIFLDPTIQKLAGDCLQAERALAAERSAPDFIIAGIADADLAAGMKGDVTPEQVLFALECRLHDLRAAINEVKIFRAEYGCLRGTA